MPLLLSAPLIAFAWLFGGWEFAAIAALGGLIAARQRSSSAVIQMSILGVVCLFAFWYTGDRRMFFPFTMQIAVLAAALPESLVGQMAAGIIVVAGFVAIRIRQQATAEVLAFEIVVAVMILVVGTFVQRQTKAGFRVAMLAAAAAYASLAL